MNNFEQQQNSETDIERLHEGDVSPEQSREAIIRDIVVQKQSVDSFVESNFNTVQDILVLLEKPVKSEQGRSKERIIKDPRKVLQSIQEDISITKNFSIDDIAKVLITSGMATGLLQSWLESNKDVVQSLGSSVEQSKNQEDELKLQLMREEGKNFLIKYFREKQREEMSMRFNEMSKHSAELYNELEERKTLGEYIIEPGIKEVNSRRQELALNSIEQLFKLVVEKKEQMQGVLTSPEVKKQLNEDLIAQKVLPELDKLENEGKITLSEREEYLVLLKGQLEQGNQAEWSDPIEKKEAIDMRRRRMNTISSDLRNIGDHVSSRNNDAADNSYDKIVDLLLREEAREKIEILSDTINNISTPEFQEKISIITEKIVYPDAPHSRFKDDENILDLNRVPIVVLNKLKGLERWPIVKKFATTSGVISKETFENVEEIFIQRMCDEQLFPGGSESFEGTSAAQKMGDLGNPKALPFMLQHIEATGSGHTNNAVVYAMEYILKECNPESLQTMLDGLPKNKRSLLEVLGDENSYMTRFGRMNSRYSICYLLQNGDLTIAKELLTKILEDGGDLDQKQLRGFYLDHTEAVQEAMQPLLKQRREVEHVMIDSKQAFWTQFDDKLLAALVNPKYGDSGSFPKRIAQEGLGITDEAMLFQLDSILETKTFKRSGFEREAFLDGLLLLNSKEDGKAVMETLLSAYRGAGEDPKRMRRIFQLLSTLDGFGEYGFVVPSQEDVKRVEDDMEIFNVRNQSGKITDKGERKKIKDAIKTREMELQNLTGLNGIEKVMTQQVVEAACRKLELPIEYKQKISDNLDALLKSGVFEIVPSLAGKYEAKKEESVKQLLKVVTKHIIAGDFVTWRYSHEQSATQLADLSDEQKEFWKKNLDPISINFELTEDESTRRADELKAAQEIMRNAKEHILDSQPHFDFSHTRLDELNAIIREITQNIKTTTLDDEKKRLIDQKKMVQAEATLIGGILEVERATPKNYTKQRILDQARELGETIRELNIPLAGLDIEQVGKIFTVGDIEHIVSYESDDPLVLLKVGTEPQETCQSWRNGGYNECLLSYVADSNKKVLNIADGDGRVIARSIIKLTDQRDENDFSFKTKRKTLFVEKPYSLLPNDEVYRAFIRMLLTKAEGMDVGITLGSGFEKNTLKIFKEEANIFGYVMKDEKLDIYIPQSLNAYEYSDALGGKISSFDRYSSLDAITFGKE